MATNQVMTRAAMVNQVWACEFSWQDIKTASLCLDCYLTNEIGLREWSHLLQIAKIYDRLVYVLRNNKMATLLLVIFVSCFYESNC